METNPVPLGDGEQNARERLVTAAVNLFGRNGFGASLRTIADEAGVSWALVRFHFGSKEGLISAVEDSVVRAYLDSVVAGANATTGEEINELIAIYGSQLVDVTTYLRRAIVEGRPIAAEFIQRLMKGDNPYARLQSEFPEETWLTDPIRMLTPRLGNLVAAPLFEQLLGRDPFSAEELRLRNAQAKRMLDLIRLGLETENAVARSRRGANGKDR